MANYLAFKFIQIIYIIIMVTYFEMLQSALNHTYLSPDSYS